MSFCDEVKATTAEVRAKFNEELPNYYQSFVEKITKDITNQANTGGNLIAFAFDNAAKNQLLIGYIAERLRGDDLFTGFTISDNTVDDKRTIQISWE